MRWRELPIVAFDTETTGLNPEDGARVIELALVVFRFGADGRLEKERHEWLLDPGVPIPRDVSEVNHIHDEDVKGKPAFSAIAPQAAAILSGAVWVAQNISFDLKFLASEFGKAGLPMPVSRGEVDTFLLSRRFFEEARSHRLGELCKRLEIPLEEAHRAGNDAEACGLCFLALAERGAPAELEGLADWGDALVDPPDTGHLVRNAEGVLLFGDGPRAGESALEHPGTLAWMTMARERKAGGWDWRYPESVRRWADRWLRLRAAGIFPSGMKGFGPADWGIDAPIGTSPSGAGHPGSGAT
jgi:DNA polymerase III epsilon subunit-like protein